MTEADKIQRLLDNYKRGLMTREEFWDHMMLVWTESVTPHTPVQPNRFRR